MIIKGVDLNPAQRVIVLKSFPYRWTTDNRNRWRYWKGVPGKPVIEPCTDQEWLKERAFCFIKDGSRLSRKSRRAVPAFMGE